MITHEELLVRLAVMLAAAFVVALVALLVVLVHRRRGSRSRGRRRAYSAPVRSCAVCGGEIYLKWFQISNADAGEVVERWAHSAAGADHVAVSG